MTKKRTLSALYLLFALAFGLNGLWMLLAPWQWFASMPLDLAQTGLPNAHFIRILGLAYMALAPLSLWCARNLKKRKPVHLAISILVVGHAVVNGVEIAMSPVAGAEPASFWLGQIGLIFLPALLFLIMALPPMKSRVKGPRERGTVKWFNATKGFGFVTREQGEDVFVHYRSIRGEGHRTLREGQRVEFVVVKGEKGLQAEDVHPV